MNNHETDKQHEEKRLKYIARNADVRKLINGVREPDNAFDTDIADIGETIERFSKRYDLDLNPDFQRGHVWTTEQQISFCESLVRKSVGVSGKLISFNCPTFLRTQQKDSDLSNMVIVDGLQRLTAIQAFLNHEFKIFAHIDGGVDWKYFNGTEFSLQSNTMKIQVFNMQYKKDILDYYLAFNDGGTVHSKEEIMRVRKMREELE